MMRLPRGVSNFQVLPLNSNVLPIPIAIGALTSVSRPEISHSQRDSVDTMILVPLALSAARYTITPSLSEGMTMRGSDDFTSHGSCALAAKTPDAATSKTTPVARTLLRRVRNRFIRCMVDTPMTARGPCFSVPDYSAHWVPGELLCC